jgi:hypothetical protein
MATKAQGNDSYDKAAPDEPVFTLRAQDVLADLAVEFWVRAYGDLRERMQQGATIEEARSELKLLLGRELPLNGAVLDAKLEDAWACASEMVRWPNRKLAD